MKKEYIKPVVEEITVELTAMLCVSGEIGGDATEPALAPEMEDF